MSLDTTGLDAGLELSKMPKHVAIIMDGNGRWAKRRSLPRVAGHRRGVDIVRRSVEFCIQNGISYLTLFAFSSENWRRPPDEVAFLMRLFLTALEKEVAALDRNQVRLRVVGDLSRFDPSLQAMIQSAHDKTARHDRLNLTIAANYGGRWDILQASQRVIAQRLEKSADLTAPISEEELQAHLVMAFAPEPDLFIRTGGEQRISNFLLWQLAYTELYFTDTFWPEFDEQQFKLAVHSYNCRERRFGRTSEQLLST